MSKYKQGVSVKALMILVLISTVSCATRAPLSYKQECGLKGMVVGGVNSTSGSVSSYNYNYGMSSGSYSGESVQCVVPQTKKQECEAMIFQKAAEPVMAYNEHAEARKFFSGLGYYAFIVPGVVMKVAFDGQRDEAVAKAAEIEKEANYGCAERDTASE